MFAGGILRVGIFTLIISTTLLAETIPFDYWYGRVIGRTQIQAIHDAPTAGHGILTANFRTGYEDIVSVGLGSLFAITPTNQSNAFYLLPMRPHLSSEVALGARTRWVIDTLDWQEYSHFSISSESRDYAKRSQFRSDQSVMILGRDIEYDAEKSLYVYTVGKLLQPRNWSLDARVAIGITDEFDNEWYQYYSSQRRDTVVSRSTSEHDTRNWSTNIVFDYGVCRNLQFTVGWKVGRESAPDKEASVRYLAAIPELSRQWDYNENKSVYRDYELFVEPVFLLNRSHWLSIRPSYKSRQGTYASRSTDVREMPDPSPDVDRNASQNHFYGLSAKHTWILQGAQVPYAQILDDHTSYYGRRLSPGSLRISTVADLSLVRYQSQNWREQYDGTPVYRAPLRMRDDRLSALSEITYFSRLNFDFSVRFTLNRHSSGYRNGGPIRTFAHSQSHFFDIGLTYYSYRWDAAQRKEIGWDQISDIDYLYGPLLRPGDWQATISVRPPARNWSAKLNDESVFNFFRGESDKSWLSMLSAGVGLCDGMDAELEASYYRDVYSQSYVGTNFYHYLTDTWTLIPRLRWQPGQRFRVDFAATEIYRDSDYTYQSQQGEVQSSAYRHLWKLYTVYTILI